MRKIDYTLVVVVMCVVLTGCANEARPPVPPVAPSYEQCHLDQCERERWRRGDETISI